MQRSFLWLIRLLFLEQRYAVFLIFRKIFFHSLFKYLILKWMFGGWRGTVVEKELREIVLTYINSMYSKTRIFRSLMYAASILKRPLRTYAVRLSLSSAWLSKNKNILYSLLNIFELHNADWWCHNKMKVIVMYDEVVVVYVSRSLRDIIENESYRLMSHRDFRQEAHY